LGGNANVLDAFRIKSHRGPELCGNLKRLIRRFTPRNANLINAIVLGFYFLVIKGEIKMRKRINKRIMLILALTIFVLGWAMRADALEPTLKWKKEFKYKVKDADLAADTGDVILSLENAGEVILFDKDGNERFHWGPRIDRRAGRAVISKDGRYFGVYSGYTEIYAEKKKVPGWSDDRIHFYNRQTKKEVWNYKSPEGVPLISPDGSYVINYAMDGFHILNMEGRETFKYIPNIFEFASIIFSPESNYIGVIKTIRQPLILFKRDGTRVWERGRHDDIASISEGASYISTCPYVLGPSDTQDPQNSYKGLVYDKKGNIVMGGFGILSGSGNKIAMHSPEKITIIRLPDKQVLKEILVQVSLPKVSNPFFAVFSYDGRYLVARKGNSLLAFDLAGDISKEITVPTLGRFAEVHLTRAGKYLLIHSRESGYERAVYCYQLY